MPNAALECNSPAHARGSMDHLISSDISLKLAGMIPNSPQTLNCRMFRLDPGTKRRAYGAVIRAMTLSGLPGPVVSAAVPRNRSAEGLSAFLHDGFWRPGNRLKFPGKPPFG